ncbi:MAG: hypothetical protein GF410_01850 [Chitinivibrionales bacterium]|nr:hypothetical protein [Chitinivibrionales bacterium]
MAVEENDVYYRNKNVLSHVGVWPGHYGKEQWRNINATPGAAVYTCPDDKYFFLTDWQIGKQQNDSGTVRLVVLDLADNDMATIATVSGDTDVAGTSFGMSVFYPLKLLAGYEIRLYGTAGSNVFGYIHGYELGVDYLTYMY